ncbi:MAG: 3-deoxy-D-manno-octulosonic acid kinase [Granulosicoccus sp.]
MQIVTQQVPDSVGEFVRYVQSPLHDFNPICLDTDGLREHGLIQGEASAGRGNTVFFTFHNQALVLRNYRRGGLIRHISKMHYLFVGLNRTRAMQEFDLLIFLQNKALPAPLPYACKVKRYGILYTASLVTHRLPGRTLAERLTSDGWLSSVKDSDEKYWQNVGDLIARFHVAGIFHADLNAHNIMLDDEGKATLIDFDRGRIRSLPKNPAQGGWCLNNILRLERSLKKISRRSSRQMPTKDTLAKKFGICREQWAESLTRLPRV